MRTARIGHETFAKLVSANYSYDCANPNTGCKVIIKTKRPFLESLDKFPQPIRFFIYFSCFSCVCLFVR